MFITALFVKPQTKKPAKCSLVGDHIKDSIAIERNTTHFYKGQTVNAYSTWEDIKEIILFFTAILKVYPIILLIILFNL